MDLFELISNDIKKAMLAKEKDKLETLRAIKKEFLEAKTAKGAGGELPNELAEKILQKMVKQRKGSAEIYAQQNRADLADKELLEVGFIEDYLPKQLSQAELETLLQELITQLGASSAKDMGKVMGAASKMFAGRAEGKVISDLVKKLLN